jgi:hypothetical protein
MEIPIAHGLCPDYRRFVMSDWEVRWGEGLKGFGKMNVQLNDGSNF